MLNLVPIESEDLAADFMLILYALLNSTLVMLKASQSFFTTLTFC